MDPRYLLSCSGRAQIRAAKLELRCATPAAIETACCECRGPGRGFVCSINPIFDRQTNLSISKSSSVWMAMLPSTNLSPGVPIIHSDSAHSNSLAVRNGSSCWRRGEQHGWVFRKTAQSWRLCSATCAAVFSSDLGPVATAMHCGE